MISNYTSCDAITLAGIDGRCDISFGGVKRILVGLRDKWDVTVEIPAGSTDDVEYITNITAKEGLMDTPYFVEYRFRKNTASYTSTVAPDNAIGNSFATTVVTLQFSKAEAKKRMILQSIINAGNACLIIEDMYGQYVYLGMDAEVVVTNAVMQSGTANTDLNGFTLELQDVSLQLPYFIDEQFDVDSLIQVQ